MNISRESVEQLLAQKPTAPAVTIYLPTHRASSPPHMSEDQIRLKNLINKAVEIIRNRDDSSQLAAELCNKLEELQDDRDFWQHQTEGLLICARPGQLHMFHLPIDTKEYVAVDTHFHLAPIFGLLRDDQNYYVLAVAQQKPVLLRGDMYDLYETGLALPESLEESLGIDEVNQKREQQRSAKGANIRTHNFGKHGGTYSFNGRGGARDPREDDRDKFLRLIDTKVCEYADHTWPLVLAGTEAEAGEFRAISKYPRIVPGYINGSFGGATPHDLFDEAWTIIKKEVIEPAHSQALEQFRQAKGGTPERVGESFAAVADAAQDGRVETLLIGMLRSTTDTVRDSNRPVPVVTFPGTEESTQAIHDIAQIAWRQNSRIFNIDAGQMPDGAALVAVFRY